jgi:hypothetical protein
MHSDFDNISVLDAGQSFRDLDAAQHVNPLAVFPELARRAPMPARRLFFTDPEGDETDIRDIVDLHEIHQPPPSVTPSSAQSLSDFSFLMSSVMRGSLATSSMRRPRETSAEMKVTLDSAAKSLQEALDESSSEEENTGLRHPPPWTRKTSVLPTSGVKDFADMGPGRHPVMQVESRVVDGTPQLAYMMSCAQENALPKVPRPIVNAIAARDEACKLSNMLLPSDGSASPASARSRVSARASGPAVQLNLADRCLGDAGLRAAGETLSMLGPVDLLNIAGNKLSCVATKEFLLKWKNYLGTMKEFDVSRNQALGRGTIQTIVDLLQDDKLRLLEDLRLCSIAIPDKLYPPLMSSLLASGTLRALSIADTRMGFGRQDPIHAVADLLADGVLTSLDISSNFIRKDGAEALARALSKTGTLKFLDLSNTAGDHMSLPGQTLVRPKPPEVVPGEATTAPPDGADAQAMETAAEDLLDNLPFSPLLIILEGLLWNSTLEKLSLAQCSLDYTADFMIGEVMLRHPYLSDFDLSANPHGVAGLSCLLRAVAAPYSAVKHLNVRDARNEEISRFSVKYDFKDPTGRYNLRFNHPQHRSVLRTLLGRPSLQGKDSRACFQNVEGSIGLGSISTDSSGIQSVPMEGSLRFSYALPAPSTPRGDGHPLAKATELHRRGLFHIGLERSLMVAKIYRTCHTEHERLIFLQAVRACFLLKASQIRFFLHCNLQTLNLQVVQCLAPNVGDRGETLELAQVLRNPDERACTRANLRNLAFLNLRNPTGHYHLELSNPSDRACALRLQTLAAFESALQRRSGLDISQGANFEPIRNAKRTESKGRASYGLLQGEGVKSFEQIALPNSGILEFDYTTFARAGVRLGPISAETLESLLAAIRHSRAARFDTLYAFRSVADRFSMSIENIQQVVETFSSLPGDQERQVLKIQRIKPPKICVRVEALLACFGSAAERAEIATKLLYGGELFTQEDFLKLQCRLGPVFMFDWARCDDIASNLPNGNSYTLNLALNDERLVAQFLLASVQQENIACLLNFEWTKSKLAEKPLEKVADWVKSWLQDFPTEGVFKLSYTKATGDDSVEDSVVDEGASLKTRREVASSLGFGPGR